jgi:MFS family permease
MSPLRDRLRCFLRSSGLSHCYQRAPSAGGLRLLEWVCTWLSKLYVQVLTFSAFIQNWQGLYACRLLIGLFEAGLIPCINVYIALVYNKSERGKRSALIFAFSAFSSAFGGLLAYGLTQVHGPNGWEGWRWLFAIEGAMTLILVPLFFFVFPKHPTTAWFLSAEEKSMIQARYDNDPHWGQDEEFSWAESLSALTDPKWFAFWIYQFSVDVSLYGFTTFLPKIISGLGHSGVRANLMTVPIYMVGLVWFLLIAYCSDRANVRGPFLAGPLLCLIIGYSILISVENLNVRFFACFGKFRIPFDSLCHSRTQPF